MLSDMVDRLRKAAQTERALGNHELELMLLDAADIIWELRNAGAENAKLREMSPEQAIEATLGRGECKDSNRRFNAWECSECKATVLLMFDDYGEPSYSVDGVADIPHYCPNCGRRVVE